MAFQDISKDNIKKITAYLPLLAKPLGRGFQTAGSSIFIDIIATMDATGFIVVFDYIDWLNKTKFDLSSMDFTAASLDTMRSVMTAHVRINRFVDGHLDSLIKNCFFESFLTALDRFTV